MENNFKRKNKIVIGLFLILFISCSVYTVVSGNETPLNTGGDSIAPFTPDIEVNIDVKAPTIDEESDYVLVDLVEIEEDLNNSYKGIEEVYENKNEEKETKKEDNVGEIEEVNKTITIDLEEIIPSSNGSLVDYKAGPLIKFASSDKGIVEIEGEIPINFPNIEMKKQIISGENYKEQVEIKSSEHLNSPLTIYTSIPESKKNQIQIYWKTEEEFVEIKEYLDTNNDGNYDRISWIVPHLSEQIFEVIIDFEIGNESSTALSLTMINPPMGVIQNPINFQVNLSYNQTELVRCDLKLNEINKNNLGPHEEFSWNFNLENGAYDWKINCSDLLNPKFNDSKEGVFVINEDITDVSLNRLHLLGEVVSLSLPQGYSNADIKIIRPDTTTITQNFNTNQITLGTDIINTWGNYTLNISATNPNKPQYVTLRTFSVVELNIWTNKNSAQTNEEMTFRAEVNSPISIQGYTLNLIENNKQYDDNVPGKEFKYTYSTAGDYATSLRVSYFPGGEVFQTTKQILISNFQDTSEPQITLDAPKNNAYIIKEPVEFRYSVSDDSKISRCTYELYRVIDGTETLDYDQTDNNIQSGGEIEIILRDFDNSKYSWYVFCCDDQSNCNGELEYNREFTFNLGGNSSTNPASSSTNYSNHENKDEID